MKLNCFVCGIEVENWDVYPEGKSPVHPIGATAFHTYGHYGSGVFDPMDASFLELVICDDCLKDRLDRIYAGVNKAYQLELDKKEMQMNKMLDELYLKDLEDEQ